MLTLAVQQQFKAKTEENLSHLDALGLDLANSQAAYKIEYGQYANSLRKLAKGDFITKDVARGIHGDSKWANELTII